MAQPTPYNRQFNFADQQAQTPSAPLPGQEVDAELNSVKLTSDQTLTNLAKIQRDDGALRNGIVTQDSLSSSLSIGFTMRGEWTAPANYLVGDGVTVDHDKFYRALSSHLSVVGQTPDIRPDLWLLVVDFTAATSDAQAAAVAAAASAGAAAGSAGAASGSASAASSSAGAAAGSAGAAQDSAEAAELSAQEAANLLSGTVTQAVRWDVDQTLDPTEQARARDNIGVGQFVGFNLGITRSQISTRIIPLNAFLVTGEAAHGDPGAGALYVRGTSGGLRAVQDVTGQWWNLKIPNEAWVGWFGAKGDGTTDDTAALQLAINSMPDGAGDTNQYERGSTLYWGTGRYKISDELLLNRNIKMIAVGNVAVFGSVAAATHKCAFFCGADSYVLPANSALGYFRILIKGFNLGDLTGHDYTIMSRGIRTIWLEENTVHGGAIASVQIEGAWSTARVEKNWFQGGGYGALRVLDFSNACLIARNRFAGYDDVENEGLALFIRASLGVWVHNNDFEYCRRHIAAVGTADSECNNLIIENNWLEGPSDYNIRLDNTVYGFKGLTIKGNSLYSPTDGKAYVGLFGGAGVFEGAVISGNSFHGTSALVMGSASNKYENVVVEGNYPHAQNGAAAFMAHKNNTDQTGIASATATKVTFGTEAFDKRDCFASSTWTPQKGRVRVSAGVNFSGGIVNGELHYLAIYKNGAMVRRKYAYAQGTNSVAITVDMITEATGTDNFEVYAYGSGTGAKTISGNQSDTWFEGCTLD